MSGETEPMLLHLAMPPSAESLVWASDPSIRSGTAFVRNEKFAEDTLVPM